MKMMLGLLIGGIFMIKSKKRQRLIAVPVEGRR
jgi:hypothetical protein